MISEIKTERIENGKWMAYRWLETDFMKAAILHGYGETEEDAITQSISILEKRKAREVGPHN